MRSSVCLFFVFSFVHSFVRVFVLSLARSFMCSFVRVFVLSLVRQFVYPFVSSTIYPHYSFMRSVSNSLIYFFKSLFILSIRCSSIRQTRKLIAFPFVYNLFIFTFPTFMIYCFLTRNWLDQMTTTNRIILSHALIII